MSNWTKLAPGVWEHSGQIYAMAQMVVLQKALGCPPGFSGLYPGASEAEVERLAAEIVERRNGGES